ncbi:MAG: tRNA (adenosine(37)-N6)-threonylcarbamoyltransferase complex ATPase subunit type 1 TsaE [Bacteroidota bacterium]
MNPSLELPLNHLNELPDLAKFILTFAGSTRHFLFDAPMGAGKTTLIKEFCKSLGSEDNFSSPSYAIVNEYAGKEGKVFHFDLYRLKSSTELLDLGIEDYLNSGSYCFFEWPEHVRQFIDRDYVKIEIEMNENYRYLRATKF